MNISSIPNQQNNQGISFKGTISVLNAGVDAAKLTVEQLAKSYQVTRNGRFRIRTSIQSTTRDIKANTKGLGMIGTALNIAPFAYDYIKYRQAESSDQKNKVLGEAKDDAVSFGIGYILGRAHPSLPILQFFNDYYKDDPNVQRGILDHLRKKAEGPNKSLRDVKLYEQYRDEVYPRTEPIRAVIKDGEKK